MPNEPHIYGEPLTGLFSTLRNLRVVYKEYDRGVYASHKVDIPVFAISIKLIENDNPFRKEEDGGWTVLFYDKHCTTSYDNKFREHLFLTLVERGYMVYLRTTDVGHNGRIYRQLLVNTHWGRKIIDKRLEAWAKRPDRAFLHKWTKDMVEAYSVSELIDRHPGFFDFLYY